MVRGPGSAAVMTPFFRPAGAPWALPSLPISMRRSCSPPFLFFRKKMIGKFFALFWPKLQLSRYKFSKFSFPRPLIFKEIPLPRPYFSLCGIHPPKKKKLSAPTPPCYIIWAKRTIDRGEKTQGLDRRT